ncbi:MAG: helix-turn-helix transcriptional regulator, partial [Clostridia bacterium]|nr:helix-turn-helix transcriptional regulator [Clostridia bacterium]
YNCFMEISEIKNHLKKYKITYSQLAELTGFNLTTIKRIFSGQIKNPHIETMRAIEQALGFVDRQSAVPTAGSDILTSEEREIISYYRELNSAGQKLVKETIKTLRATSAQSEQKKKI